MHLHAMLSRSSYVSLRQGQLCISGNPPRSLPIEDLDTLTLEDGAWFGASAANHRASIHRDEDSLR